MTKRIDDAARLLAALLNARDGRSALVEQFQRVIWDSDEILGTSQIDELLRDLAYDLDCYVVDPDARSEDESYYGDERLENEVSTAILRLRQLGVVMSA
jgi:hypothetical protein